MNLQIPLADEAATIALGTRIAPLLRIGDVIALKGDLGAGKSTFARAVIRALMGAQIDAPSPTFTIVQTYETPGLPIWHFDLYRLEHPDELRELGMEDTIDGLALIEWPERMGDAMPQNRLEISLEFSPNGRIAAFHANAGGQADGEDWSERLATLTI